MNTNLKRWMEVVPIHKLERPILNRTPPWKEFTAAIQRNTLFES